MTPVPCPVEQPSRTGHVGRLGSFGNDLVGHLLALAARLFALRATFGLGLLALAALLLPLSLQY
jgi:hypothetical protein